MGGGADGLEGDVGAVAAGLGIALSECGMWCVQEGRHTYDFGGFHHGELPEVACEEADPEEGGFVCERGELGLDVVGSLVFALHNCQHFDHSMGTATRHTSI